MSRRKSRLRETAQGENNHYWMSYSDLMSALLLIFALLLMVNILGNQDEMEAKDEMIEEVIGVKTRLIEELNNAFNDSDLEMKIDPQTGAILFSSGVFYDHDSSKLSKEGKKNLETFIPKYISVLLSDEFSEHISQIIIEGHTDLDGSYLYNLELSQDRAFSVVEEIFSKKFPDFDEKEPLRKLITSNGRSYTMPIYDENDKIDQDESRRVEFKFRLKDEELIKNIEDMVTKDE